MEIFRFLAIHSLQESQEELTGSARSSADISISKITSNVHTHTHNEQEKALIIDCWQQKVYKSISTATSLTTKSLSPGANPVQIYH